ncbi:MAG: hypothetical protein ABWY63_00975 [Hyphomicrobiaceae bacterium]
MERARAMAQGEARAGIGKVRRALFEELADEIERLRNSFEPGVASDIISRQSHEIERLRGSTAMTDIVERLRGLSIWVDAADEIERLRSELEEERDRPSVRAVYDTALEEAAKVAEQHGIEVSNEKIGKACSRNIANAIRALKEERDDTAAPHGEG